MFFYIELLCWIVLIVTLQRVKGDDNDYNVLHKDGSFEFGYNNPDSYHYADGNRNNVVRGEFGGRNPGTGAVDTTLYTAGPRGFRPRGKNVVRKYDLGQSGARPVGSRDDPYYDPYESPEYKFSFRTRTYNRDESANRVGDVNGRYSYTDDVGERHNVEFVAGKKTGFHVKTPFPDSNPRAYGPLYFSGRGKPIPRGRTSVQRGTDGSYRFVSAGPDQRRTEVSDSSGHVRGSYTYLDDKGVQHSVHYIAGPETGYRVLKQVKGPHLPTVFPFGRPEIIPPDFYDYGKDTDLFDTAASGHVKPTGEKKPPSGGAKDEVPSFGSELDKDKDDFGNKIPFGGSRPSGSKPGVSKPSYFDEESDDSGDFGDIFGGSPPVSSTTTFSPRPTASYTPQRPASEEEDDGSYKHSGEDGSYRPSTTSSGSSTTTTFKPSYGGVTTSRPSSGRPDSSESGYESGEKPYPSFDEGSTKPKPKPTRPSYGDFGKPTIGVSKPTPGTDSNSDEDNDFGLFGSESGRPRPPYTFGGKPVISIGLDNSLCTKCSGTVLTNLGERTFYVPPGVSVRAHVQAIDLLPINPSIPSPSDQFNADLKFKTEQLNAIEDRLVKDNETEDQETTSTTSATISRTDQNSTSF